MAKDSDIENENGKDKAFEILFRWKDSKAKEDALIGPVIVQAKTERVAIAKAAIKNAATLAAEANLLTLNVDCRVF